MYTYVSVCVHIYIYIHIYINKPCMANLKLYLFK